LTSPAFAMIEAVVPVSDSDSSPKIVKPEKT
jgi:hypothetical protein